MNRGTRNHIIRIAIMVVVAAAVVLLANAFRPSWAESAEQRANREIEQKYDLTLWYYDSDLTDYLSKLKEDFFRKEGLNVKMEEVSVVGFFENINKMNVEKDGAPDLFITDTSRLEQAYLGALSKQNTYSDIYNLKNYSLKSLTSVMFDGKLAAYPLAFDMEFFVYDHELMSKAPSSFDKIGDMSSEFTKSAESGVDMVILYDTVKLLYNYHFIGDAINIGGDRNDDINDINIDTEKLKAALSVYKNFLDKVKISTKTTDYELVENSFAYGRSMSAILDCSSLSLLNRENTPYKIVKMPNVSDTIESKPLSSTLCVCVNPISDNTGKAEKLARFMTYENTGIIYESTGYLSCKRAEEKEKGFREVYDLYDETASLPKFIETEDIWKDIKRMLNDVAVGVDIDEAVQRFETAVKVHFETRSSEE